MAYSKILLPVTKKVLWLCTWFLDNIVQNTFSILVRTNFILKRFSLIFLFLRVESTNRLFVLCRRATLIINAVFFSFFFVDFGPWKQAGGQYSHYIRLLFLDYIDHNHLTFCTIDSPNPGEAWSILTKAICWEVLENLHAGLIRSSQTELSCCVVKKKKKKKNFMSFILYSKLRCIFIGKH